MTSLRPETVEFLKRRRTSTATRMGDRSLALAGGRRRQRYMGRARLFLGKSVSWKPSTSPYAVLATEHVSKGDAGDEPRDAHGKWSQGGALKRSNDKLKRIEYLTADNAEDYTATGGGTYYRDLLRRMTQNAKRLRKDLDAGDVHIPSAIGNDAPRRRRPKLSLARPPMPSLFEKDITSEPRDSFGRWVADVALGGVATAAAGHFLGGGRTTTEGRERGHAEMAGRVGGTVAVLSQTPKIMHHVGRFVARRFRRGKVGAFVAGGVAAGEALSLGRDAGGYVGRKVDEAVGRVFKGSVEQTMHEYKHGKLRSGSKRGPVVQNRKQAIAIALSQAGLSNR